MLPKMPGNILTSPEHAEVLEYENPQFWANIAYSTLGRRMIANPGWTAYEKATSTSQFTGGIGQTSGIPPRGFFRMSVVLR